MQDFQISSNREGSYYETFSVNNSNRQKDIVLKLNYAFSNNNNTSRFDQFSNYEESENIKYKLLLNNIQADSMNCKIQGNSQYEINELNQQDETYSQIHYNEDLSQSMSSHVINNFNSQTQQHSNNQTKIDSKITGELQFHNIGAILSNNTNISYSQMPKKVQKIQQLEMIKGDFSLVQYYDSVQDDCSESNNNQNIFESNQNKKHEQNISKQCFQQNQKNQMYNNQTTHHTQETIQSQSSKQQSIQKQLSHNQLFDDSRSISIDNGDNIFIQKQNSSQINKNPQNFKIFQQKQTISARINNFLTSEDSNTSNQIDNLSIKNKSKTNLMSSNDNFEQNNYKGQHNNAFNNQKEISSICDEQEQEEDEINCQQNDQSIQFVTLQNDLGDSSQTQNNILLNKYFNINNSQRQSKNNQKDEILQNNQSAHFKTLNPEYLDYFQQEQQINQMYSDHQNKGIKEKQIVKYDNITKQEKENIINISSSLNNSNRHQVNQDHPIYANNDTDTKQFNNNINNYESIKNKFLCIQENEENNYKTIDIDDQNMYQKKGQNINDQEIMKKIYKTNQQLSLQNKKLNQDNQLLQKELGSMKSDLQNKYQDIRNNNDNIFKTFEEQSNLMLKRQKEKYEEKISKLSSQLRDCETQNLYKKDNFRDRNNQLYAMVLKLEKEKQELHDKNLQLIKKQINNKNEYQINAQNRIGNNTTLEYTQGDTTNKQINHQSYLNFQNSKIGNNEQLNNINDQSSYIINQSSFYQGIISPMSSSSRQHKSKSIDVVKKNIQQQSEYSIQDKNEGYIMKDDKKNGEKRYKQLLLNYQKILDENSQLRTKNQSILDFKNLNIDRSIDQSTVLSPSLTTIEAKAKKYISQYTNNESTQCNSSYYQPSIYQKGIMVKPHHKKYSSHILSDYEINKNKSIDNSIISNDRTDENYKQLANKYKRVTYVNIPPQKNFKTEESNYSPINSNKRNSNNYKLKIPKYSLYNDDKENNKTLHNRNTSIDEQNYSNLNKPTRINSNVLKKKQNTIDEDIKRSSSKQKDSKKKKQNQNKTCLEINISKDKIKSKDEKKEKLYSNFNINYIQNILQQNKPKKNRSNSVSKSTIASTKTTINYDKDNSYYEKENKKNKNTNPRKDEIKRSCSNNKRCKAPSCNKTKI